MDEVCKACGGTKDVKRLPIDGEIGKLQIIVPNEMNHFQDIGFHLCQPCRVNLSLSVGNTLQQIKAEAEANLELGSAAQGINPTWERGEIPLCSASGCRYCKSTAVNDWWHCSVTGKSVDSDGICEPAVKRMAKALRPFATIVDSVSRIDSEGALIIELRHEGPCVSVKPSDFQAAVEALPKGGA